MIDAWYVRLSSLTCGMGQAGKPDVRVRPMAARWACAAVFVACSASAAMGQSSSLFHQPTARGPASLSEVSWTYQPPPEKRQLRLNDIVTVLVDDKTQVDSQGKIDQKKQSERKWSLKDWVLFRHGSLIPDPQSAGSPTVDSQVDNKYRADGQLTTKESIKLKVACRVVDIRPNGLLFVEGRRTIAVNEENWELSLSGTIRPEDVLPNNTVLSENVLDPRLVKRESGHVRDGYRRGWLERMMDTYQPF
jgi:flagellar L-ring protein precursor FlgH